jgi:deoxyhypusine synthase
MMGFYKNMGFQAANLGKAIEIINKMLSWRLSDEPINEKDDEETRDETYRKNTKTTIFLGYTSNLISSGLRETIKFLVKNKLVDCIVTTAGGVEEDFIKCLAPTFMGEFHVNDREYRKKGLNRIGNMVVPNDNYCKFEDWIMPIFDEMYNDQIEKGIIYSPSKIIKKLGEKINDESSVYYWAAKNDIPVYCPAITDGSIGDMLFFHSFQKSDFIVDLIQDIRGVNKMAMLAKKTGAIILGGGIVKHHIMNANLMRNGTDFACYINTGTEYDGSDAGARPSEALSWGKIRIDGIFTKVWAEATLVFPIIVAQTFAKYHKKQQEEKLENERETKETKEN